MLYVLLNIARYSAARSQITTSPRLLPHIIPGYNNLTFIDPSPLVRTVKQDVIIFPRISPKVAVGNGA